jgi:general L-amino acid transport system substrate-binding protein
VVGFADRASDGRWCGFGVDYCRAFAAAIFNDANKGEFQPLSAQDRFRALQSGAIDVLSRNTTWTLSRDASPGLDFDLTLFYDGQGMMMPVELPWRLGSTGPRLTLGLQLTLRDLKRDRRPHGPL